MTDKAARESFDQAEIKRLIAALERNRFQYIALWEGVTPKQLIDAIRALAGYQAAHDAAMAAHFPNIAAIASGTISGSFREWPAIRGEAEAILLQLQAAQQREAELRAALADARSGFGMAYNAIQNDCTDEALLHCGAHEARAHKALATQPTNKGETT